jgi:hypothetical protein
MTSAPTRDEITAAASKVQVAVRKCLASAYSGDRAKAYAAAEEAQHAAFDLKILFSLGEEVTPPTSPD